MKSAGWQEMSASDSKSQGKTDALVIAGLLRGLSNSEAAGEAGISERTVYRRLQDPDFRRQLANASSAVVTQTVSALGAASEEAVRQLLQLVTGARSEHARLGAARSILEFSAQLRESEELEQRISALEGGAEPNEAGPWQAKRAG